jgi:hypothetical protein
MKGLTGPQLCEVAGMHFKRFEALRRNYRKAFDEMAILDEGSPVFPVDDDLGGGWTRYDYEDALRLALTVALEARGMNFERATRIAIEAPRVGEITGSTSDLWVGRQYYPTAGSVGSADLIVRGTAEEVLQPAMPKDALESIIACNVTAIHRQIGPKFLAVIARIEA